MSARTIISDAEVDGRRVSVVIEGTAIVEVVEGRVPAGEDLIDAAGGALIPGLHDHHVHLLAMAARDAGPDLDAAATPEEFDQVLADAAIASGERWLRASGHDEHRHGPLDRDRLDAIVGACKVRVQHRSGLAWVLSSTALVEVLVGEIPPGVELDRTGRPTGRLLRLDRWLADRIGVDPPALTGVGEHLAAVGITGVTDATLRLGVGRISALRAAVEDGSLPQRLTVLGSDAGERELVEGWATVGPAKLLVDEVLGLDPEALASAITVHHDGGRAVAIHAVSRAETVTAVTALALAGTRPGDRSEHGSVLPRELDAVLAGGGVTVIVQPALVAERGDHYLDVVDEDDLAHLHRVASLLDAGVRVAVGSDAPVTAVDPWAAIAAATDRRTRSGHLLGAVERVDPATALGWYLTDPLDPGGPVRRVRAGTVADLCLLDGPLADVLHRPVRDRVRMTWVGGRLVHR